MPTIPLTVRGAELLREELQRGIDTALPQFRMSRAAKGLQGGHA